MKKALTFLLSLFLFFSFVFYAYAAPPSIISVKYKSAGDSPRIAVSFDQPVKNTSGGDLTPSDFVLSYASGTAASILNVMPSPNKDTYVLIVDQSVNPSSSGKWGISASTSVVNFGGESASTSTIDLFGNGDSQAPSIFGVYLHSSSTLALTFSEKVFPSTISTSTIFNLVTLDPSDTPGIQSINLESDLQFVVVNSTSSTTLDWGSGNSITLAGIEDLVGNRISTSTVTVLPPLKISEVSAESSVNTQDEFLELYNFGNITLDTSNLFLHIKNGVNDYTKALTKFVNSIGAQSFYLIGSNSNYSGSVALDASYDSLTGDITPNSGVYISATSTPDALVIDLVGMGTSGIFEGAVLPALPSGKSYERKADQNSTASSMDAGGSDEFRGNSFDTNNNNNDFVLRNAPQPQNSSFKEFPFGGPGGPADSGAPQVVGSFPMGDSSEVVPDNISFVGFGFNEPVNESSVSTSTVKLFLSSNPSVNLCSSVVYNNFPPEGTPPGQCIIDSSDLPLQNAEYTFKIFGDATNSTSTLAVRDVGGNALNQPTSFKGDGNGNYVIKFTPSSGGGGFTFNAPPAFLVGSLPFTGGVNIPTDIKKIYLKFSDNIQTSSANTSNIKLKNLDSGNYHTIDSISVSASDAAFSSDLVILNISQTLSSNAHYQIEVSGLIDLNNNSLPAFVSDFYTGGGVDTTGPSVSGKLPDISSGVPVNAIDIHVMTDDKLQPDSISSSTVKVFNGSNQVPGMVDFDPFSGEIMFIANNVFQANTTYTVSINATGTTPCVKNLSGLCLQDTDGTQDGYYKFSFTTGGSDNTSPKVIFANADQMNLSISFDEPINKLEAEKLSNYTLLVNGATTTISSLAGQKAFYDPVSRTVAIQNLNLPLGASFKVIVSGIHDLSGNLIDSNQNYFQGTVKDVTETKGFVGPGGPAPNFYDMPDNFASSTFGFVPQVEVRPFSPQAGVSTIYSVNIPISKQILSFTSGGKIVLTFPSGFDVSGAVVDPSSPMNSDVNGPGAGVITISSLVADKTSRTITIGLSSNTRCDSGNSSPCSGDSHDFLTFDIKGIVNSSIPKDASSGGYTVDVKTLNGNTLLESLTSSPFYISQAGAGVLQVVLNAQGAISGTTTVRIFSPLTGPQDALSTQFSSGVATSTFYNLSDGRYDVFTDPIVNIGGSDYIGQFVPTPVDVFSGATTTANIILTPTSGMTSLTVQLSGPAGKEVDVFANAGEKFVKRKVTTTGSVQNVVLKLSDGNWNVGVGPAMPDNPFLPPKDPDYIIPKPEQVIVNQGKIQESSGTANDGVISLTLVQANKTISGRVEDENGKVVVGAEVHAYSPLKGFGTFAQSGADGSFVLPVADGVYQVGASLHGLPSGQEVAVEVSGSSLFVDGKSVSSVVLKITKPDISISGKVLDQNNNPIQGAGVYAYCDPSVANNSCFGPAGYSETQTKSDGSYTLYVVNGTWKIGAFLPGFGNMPEVTKVVSGSNISNLNFYPSSSITFRTLSGTVCKDDDPSGSQNVCGAGDTKLKGVFINAFGPAGGNDSVSAADGTYSLKLPAGSGYTVEAFDPNLGRLKPLTNIDLSSGDSSGNDIVIPKTNLVSVSILNSSLVSTSSEDLMIDFFDFNTKIGNHLEIKNATSSTISLPNGLYKITASLRGLQIPSSSILSNSASTTVSLDAKLTVDGNEAIKIVLPELAFLEGTVYSSSKSSGNELSDALVNIGDPSSGVFVSVQTDANGHYSANLPLGKYNVFAQKPGYVGNPLTTELNSTSTPTSLDLVLKKSSLTISGTITINGSPATKAFVRAERLGGGFASAQTDSSGQYSLSVNSGTWRVFAVAEGYKEKEYSTPVGVSSTSKSGVNINLTSKVSLAKPKICQIVPSKGGECIDNDNGIRATIPPGALGSSANPATFTIKQTNTLQQTSSAKPIGEGFDFKVKDYNGKNISTFNSPIALEFIRTVTNLANNGITTKSQVDKLKIILWSETIKGYDVLKTSIEYLDANGNLVSQPNADLSNVAKIRMKALTTHFSGGGPGQGGDSMPPAAPTNVASSAGSSSITVSWSEVTTNQDGTLISDLSDYRVWRSTSQTGGYSVVGTTNQTSYSDTSVSSGITYYYKVTARDTNGNESDFSQPSGGSALAVSSSGGGGGVLPTSPTQTALPSSYISVNSDNGGRLILNNTLNNTQVVLDIPKASFSGENASFNIKVVQDGYSIPQELKLVGNVYDVYAKQNEVNLKSFLNPLSLKITYSDSLLAGKSEDSLAIYWFDSENSTWKRLASSQVNKAENYVVATTNHLTYFALIADESIEPTTGSGVSLQKNIGIQSGTSYKLIKAIGDNKIYLVFGSYKRHIPNPSVFESYGFKWSDVQEVSVSELERYKTSNLIRKQGDIKVYLVQNGKKRWIKTEDEFIKNGFRWDMIADVNEIEFNSYQEEQERSYELLRAKGDIKVYLVQNGKKRWIKTEDEFIKNGFSWSEVKEVLPSELDKYEEKNDLLTMELEYGMRNDQVKALQRFLAQYPEIYPEGLVTGYFGPLTKLAVKRFQAKYGIRQVGRVGPKTLAKINELAR